MVAFWNIHNITLRELEKEEKENRKLKEDKQKERQTQSPIVLF